MRAAVLGSPIGHSLSPGLHRAAYTALGLSWEYDALEVPSGALAGFLAGLGPEWAGLSLTMPLKQEVLPLLDEASELVQRTGAANTLVLRDGRRVGHNTDVAGIVRALAEAGVTSCRRAAVLGAGATAASAVAAVEQLGGAWTVLARDPSRSALPASVLEPSALAGADLVINTTPAGALDDFTALPAPVTLLDVVYAPWPTRLAARYAQVGAVVVGGAAMLLHQAAEQVTLMTGLPAPLEQMRAALP